METINKERTNQADKSSLLKLYETVIEETTIPVKALVRIISSRSSFNEWIGIPLVILEV